MEGAREFIADRGDHSGLAAAIAEAEPEVVVDMIPFTPAEAKMAIGACKGIASRAIALSSIDVYLAYGRIHRTEPGPIQATPLSETSALRETVEPEGPDKDKVGVERVYLKDAELPATILRLPAIYGPRDKQRRLRAYLKRMDDARDAILLAESMAGWRFSRGYVENVAQAITLAIENSSAAGEIYNVAEPSAMTELEWVRRIGEAADWHGEVVVLPDIRLPKHLQPKVDFAQDWEVTTEKIRTQLGYAETVEVGDGIRRTIEWERSNPPEIEPFEYDYDKEDAALIP